jgi:putative endonuclease
MKKWYVYMLRCADNSLYTGITTDPVRRLNEHNHNNRLAAAYTRTRRPVVLVYREVFLSRSAATRRELEIKSMQRMDKLKLAGTG